MLRLSKNLLGGSEGRSPPKGIPNPATCAVDSEALRSKVSLHVSPAAPKAQGKRVLAEKAAAGGLFRQAGLRLLPGAFFTPGTGRHRMRWAAKGWKAFYKSARFMI